MTLPVHPQSRAGQLVRTYEQQLEAKQKEVLAFQDKYNIRIKVRGGRRLLLRRGWVAIRRACSGAGNGVTDGRAAVHSQSCPPTWTPGRAGRERPTCGAAAGSEQCIRKARCAGRSIAPVPAPKLRAQPTPCNRMTLHSIRHESHCVVTGIQRGRVAAGGRGGGLRVTSRRNQCHRAWRMCSPAPR